MIQMTEGTVHVMSHYSQ